MKRQRKTTEILDWEELEEAPNTRGPFPFFDRRARSSTFRSIGHRLQRLHPKAGWKHRRIPSHAQGLIDFLAAAQYKMLIPRVKISSILPFGKPEYLINPAR
jgi:hypothetical protein